jgi:hypothetical protein
MKMEKLSMKAIVLADGICNAKNLAHEKEQTSRLVLVAKIEGKLREVVDVRFYMSRSGDGASPVYCSIWVTGKQHVSGHGRASGYGYHKTSQALQSAIGDAGIHIYGSNYGYREGQKRDFKKRSFIGGCGDESMHEAMKAIARAVGATGQLLIV